MVRRERRAESLDWPCRTLVLSPRTRDMPSMRAERDDRQTRSILRQLARSCVVALGGSAARRRQPGSAPRNALQNYPAWLGAIKRQSITSISNPSTFVKTRPDLVAITPRHSRRHIPSNQCLCPKTELNPPSRLLPIQSPNQRRTSPYSS